MLEERVRLIEDENDKKRTKETEEKFIEKEEEPKKTKKRIEMQAPRD